MRNGNKNSVVKPVEKDLGKCTTQENMETYLERIKWEKVDWIRVSRNRIPWFPLVTIVTEFWDMQMSGCILIG
jgi:hypothetical protein